MKRDQSSFTITRLHREDDVGSAKIDGEMCTTNPREGKRNMGEWSNFGHHHWRESGVYEQTNWHLCPEAGAGEAYVLNTKTLGVRLVTA